MEEKPQAAPLAHSTNSGWMLNKLKIMNPTLLIQVMLMKMNSIFRKIRMMMAIKTLKKIGTKS